MAVRTKVNKTFLQLRYRGWAWTPPERVGTGSGNEDDEEDAGTATGWEEGT
jgi:hypothetical protein